MSKNNPTKRHHYTPRCYLDAFTSDNSLLHFVNLETYRKFKNYKVEHKGPMAVCHKENFYKIEELTNKVFNNLEGLDPLHIESSALKSKEDSYRKTLEKILTVRELSDSEAVNFSTFLILLKIRNSAWRKREISPMVQNSISDLVEQYKKKYNGQLNNELIDLIGELYYINLVSDPNLKKNFQLFSINNRSLGETTSLHIDFRVACLEWTILRAPIFKFFLTTDNPGVAIDKFEKIHDLKFVDDSKFYLPLTPKHCLIINSSNIDNYYYETGRKKIRSFDLQPVDVDRINIMMINKADEFVISKIKATIDTHELLIKSLAKL